MRREAALHHRLLQWAKQLQRKVEHFVLPGCATIYRQLGWNTTSSIEVLWLSLRVKYILIPCQTTMNSFVFHGVARLYQSFVPLYAILYVFSARIYH